MESCTSRDSQLAMCLYIYICICTGVEGHDGEVGDDEKNWRVRNVKV